MHGSSDGYSASFFLADLLQHIYFKGKNKEKKVLPIPRRPNTARFPLLGKRAEQHHANPVPNTQPHVLCRCEEPNPKGLGIPATAVPSLARRPDAERGRALPGALPEPPGGSGAWARRCPVAAVRSVRSRGSEFVRGVLSSPAAAPAFGPALAPRPPAPAARESGRLALGAGQPSPPCCLRLTGGPGRVGGTVHPPTQQPQRCTPSAPTCSAAGASVGASGPGRRGALLPGQRAPGTAAPASPPGSGELAGRRGEGERENLKISRRKTPVPVLRGN